MSISILRSGIMDSIQDNGRCGFGNLGINTNGAMDRYAMQVANFLVMNEADRAVLEIHFPGPQILFEQNALISITGADFSATLNGDEAPCWRPIAVRRNSVLQFIRNHSGARAYLAVHGGFSVPDWLGSSSTNLKARAGGFEGRKLEKGDEVRFGESNLYFPSLLKDEMISVLPWSVNSCSAYNKRNRIVNPNDPSPVSTQTEDGGELYKLPLHEWERYKTENEFAFIPGREWDLLTADSKTKLLTKIFNIHSSSDRMGYYLNGPELLLKEEFQLVSSAVNFGTIQLLPNNQLIILMADHQTTGGYPRIGHLITVHLTQLAQLPAGEQMRFKIVDSATAEQLLVSQAHELMVIRNSCTEKLKAALCSA